jgi:CubicO group peptidase (beta-lactamase class C family)
MSKSAKLLQIFNHLVNSKTNRNFIALLSGFILFISLTLLPSFASNSPQFHILDNQPPQLAPADSAPAPPAQPQSLEDSSEFAAFVNSYFEQQLAQFNIPGAAISVVKDGEVFFTNGYGYADIEQKIRVDPEKTLFRVASLSKLFTATAAMQLYEQGAIALDGDVSQYLEGWQLENPYSD